MESRKGIRTEITNHTTPFIAGLKWDAFQGQDIDLDLQCILMNELGQIEEAIYFNEQSSKIANIRLSEDSKGEKDGFDEVLTIDLNSCPFNVKYVALMICSYKEQPLKFVESSLLQILQQNITIFEYSIGTFSDNTTMACLPCIFEKSFEGTWSMVQIGIPGTGKTFLENESIIKQGLELTGFDMNLFLECKNWTGGKSFSLDKNQSLVIPTSMKSVTVGLGWDTRCDIDSSIQLFNNENTCFENIYFGNKRNASGTVIHNGDNTTGFGSGDDETIHVDLEKMPANVKTIWAVITIYSSSYQFDDVKGAYCRLFSKEFKSEFCRFNLSENKDGVSTGNIMCAINRCREGQWSISPKGFYTKNTQRSSQVTEIIQLLLKNDFSRVKILKSKVKPVVKKAELPGKQYEVVVEKATGLAAFDSNGLSDPYVAIRVNGKQRGKTPIIKKTLNPTWNYQQRVQLAEGDKIEFRLFDYDFLASDDFMGSGFVEVKGDLLNAKKLTLDLKVLNKDQTENSKFTGNLQVIFTKLA